MNSSIRSVAGFAARVTEEDRKVLLGHKNDSITSHYSAAALGKLIDEANNISAEGRMKKVPPKSPHIDERGPDKKIQSPISNWIFF